MKSLKKILRETIPPRTSPTSQSINTYKKSERPTADLGKPGAFISPAPADDHPDLSRPGLSQPERIRGKNPEITGTGQTVMRGGGSGVSDPDGWASDMGDELEDPLAQTNIDPFSSTGSPTSAQAPRQAPTAGPRKPGTFKGLSRQRAGRQTFNPNEVPDSERKLAAKKLGLESKLPTMKSLFSSKKP